jgi:CPA1 family monovalent cation:H+ antiporter
MAMFHVVALLVSLAAAFSYLNYRFVRLHPSIGVMFIAMLTSLTLIAIEALSGGAVGSELRAAAAAFLGKVRFDQALMDWMLAFLLFAGGLSVDLGELSRQRGLTALLATVGTVLSTAIVAALVYPLARLLHMPLPLHACLLLGAMISPTDPVAVLAMVRRVAVPKSTETIIAAESLFNDGVGVVLFLTLLHSTGGGDSTSAAALVHVGALLLRVALGGALLGLMCGGIIYLLLARVWEYQLEVLLTLALAMGAYSLADVLGVSGPIAVVVAGLLVGNRSRRTPSPEEPSMDVEHFWELLDELLNAVLFMLIGLELLVMPYTLRYLLAAMCVVPVVLAARWVSAAAVVQALGRRRLDGAGLVAILTWGGLRGGLPIAMALILPAGPTRDPIVAITYGVVAFSILVQGTTLRPLVARWTRVPTPPLQEIAS